MASAALLADKSAQVSPPFVRLAAPLVDTGYQLKADAFHVSANFERELCDYRKVGQLGRRLRISAKLIARFGPS